MESLQFNPVVPGLSSYLTTLPLVEQSIQTWLCVKDETKASGCRWVLAKVSEFAGPELVDVDVVEFQEKIVTCGSATLLVVTYDMAGNSFTTVHVLGTVRVLRGSLAIRTGGGVPDWDGLRNAVQELQDSVSCLTGSARDIPGTDATKDAPAAS